MAEDWKDEEDYDGLWERVMAIAEKEATMDKDNEAEFVFNDLYESIDIEGKNND